MERENSYTIYSKGEIQKGFESDNVKNNFAKLFNLNVSEVSPLFEGKCIFRRTGLNQFTAIQYQQSFNKIGTICYLEQEVLSTAEPVIKESVADEQPEHRKGINQPIEHSQVKVDSTLCPKCQSSNINAEQCLDCGIYFAKLRKKTNVTEDSVSISENEDSHYLENMQKATRIIKYVTIYLFAIFTVDNYILDHQQSLRYIIAPNLDISLLPYFIGHIGLVWGCYYLALAKGRSGIWGGLGLISMPGLGILLLLPNEHKTKSDGKTKLFAIVIISLSVYWVVGYINKSVALTEFIEKSIVLREQRHEYPSAILDTRVELYKSEINELKAYLNQGFVLLSEYNFRPRAIKAITESMFAETMRLFIWVNYQQYRQYRNGGQGSEYLQKKNVRSAQIDVFKFIKKGVENTDVFALSQAYEEWFIGSLYEGEYDFLNNFNKELMESRGELLHINALGEKKVIPPEFSFENIGLPRFSGVDVSVREDLMLFDFSTHNLPDVNQPLVIASYYRPYKQYSGSKRKVVDHYYLIQVQISPDFPNKYLASDFSVFNAADIIPLMN